jgi:hypothetical protein
MMPLGAGPEGSPDNQKVQNWDGPQLGEVNTTSEVAQTVGPVNVGRYGYLNLVASANLVPCVLTAEWSQTKAGMPKLPTESRWRRKFVIDAAAISANALLRIPNLGPWVRVRLAPIAGSSQMFMVVGASNRIAPWEHIPQHSILAEGSHVYAAGGLETFLPESYWAGPVRVKVVTSAAQAVSLEIQAENESAVFVIVDKIVCPASSEIYGSLQAPLGAWKFVLRAAGATTGSFSAIPQVTGSS